MKQSIQKLSNSQIFSFANELRALFEDKFQVSPENLHLYHNQAELLTYGSDQHTPFHKYLYTQFDNEYSSVVSSYRSMAEKLALSFDFDFDGNGVCIQKYPTLRIQFPGNISVFEFHRDSDYNHPLGETNFFLAITKCHQSSALHVEQHLGWSDYTPLNLEIGCIAALNTSIYKHGDIPNQEGYTRVSVDFRIIPYSVIKELNPQTSLTSGRLFNSDDYFYLFTQ